MARVLNNSNQRSVRLQKNAKHIDHIYFKLPSQENRANNQENLPLKEEEIVIEEGIDLNVVLPFNETISVSNIKAVIIENDEKEIEVEKETEIVKVAKAKPIKLKVKLKDVCNINLQEAVNYALQHFEELSKHTSCEEKIALYTELGRIGRDSEAPVWDAGLLYFDSLQDVVIQNDFWKHAQRVQDNEDLIAKSITYLTSFSPPIIYTMNYFQKQYCATEFLRNVLNYFWKQSEDIVTQIEADKEPLAVSSSGIAEDKKKEVILYYVVGSTIHSACGRKKRNGVNEQLVLNTLALSGIESKDIYPYIGVLIPNVVSWILKQNRGGLTFATIQTFELFKLINEKLEPFYGGKYFKSQKENKERKNSIKDVLNVNLEIQELWHKILDSNPKVCKDKKFRDKIFHRLIESFCKLRGKGLTLFLRGKHFSGKMHKSTPGLRKGLKKKLES